MNPFKQNQRFYSHHYSRVEHEAIKAVLYRESAKGTMPAGRWLTSKNGARPLMRKFHVWTKLPVVPFILSQYTQCAMKMP